MPKFMIGSSNFSELVARLPNGEYAHYFVDKSFFIAQVLEESKNVILLPRPRRFGKTVNLDMLQYFFSIDNAAQNRELFTELKIASSTLSTGKACLDYQGQYPVIMLSFKSLKQRRFSDFLLQMKELIADVCLSMEYLANSPKLLPEQKTLIQQFIAETAADKYYNNALKTLMKLLNRHYGKPVVVLIDEYDVPFQYAITERDYARDPADREAGKEYVEELRKFFALFLGEALKDNKMLYKCVMTGIVRIAGAGVFSDLNNLGVWTILDNRFEDSIGFTEPELIDLLAQVGKSAQLDEYRSWYNGYRIGKETIYNPWSVVNALDRDEFEPYWLDTSHNDLIFNMLINPLSLRDAETINQTVAGLISKEVVTQNLSKGLVFDSRVSSLQHLWILLLSAGYLKATHLERVNDGIVSCQLQIPNREVHILYKRVFQMWLLEKLQVREDSAFIEHLLRGELEPFGEILTSIYQQVVSVRDVNDNVFDESARYEAFYHGFMVGLLSLSLIRGKHTVVLRSNRESGNGYYDLSLEPKNIDDPIYHTGVLFEFKRCLTAEELEQDAEKALMQIQTKDYISHMQARGVRNISLIGVAFHRKQLAYKTVMHSYHLE